MDDVNDEDQDLQDDDNDDDDDLSDNKDPVLTEIEAQAVAHNARLYA
jgi:hypothetical protein